MKKILMICDFYGVGQTYQENLLAKYYTKLGHSVVILASTTEILADFIAEKYDKNKPKSITYENTVKIIRLPYKLNLFNRIRSFPEVYSILTDEKPDLIFAHDIYFNLHEAVKYKKMFKIKLILDYHADYTNSGKNWLSINILHKLIRKPYFKRFQNEIDKIYPIVPEGAKFLNDIYDVQYEDMEVLPLGCDFDKITKIKKKIDIKQEREKLGIFNNDLIVINGGKFNKLKKTHLTIETLRKLKNPNIHLLIFGKAEAGHEDYENFMHESSKDLNVHFLGWINSDEAYKYMLISDVALFPSSQSVLWQQCIGAGLPLIAGDSGQQDMSYLNKNNNLIRVDKENINAEYFSEILNDLYIDRSKLMEMKKGSIRTTQEYLNYELIVTKTLRDCEII